jgi:hypothetical protein
MKMLGQPNTPEFHKYSEISSAIFNELSDAGETYGRWSQDARLIGSDGTVHTKEEMQKAAKERKRGFGGTTRSLDMFIASLNWLAYKAIYYSLAAKYFKADTFLHPIRHAYQIHWMRKTGAYGHDFTAKLVQSLAGNISTSVSKIIDNSALELKETQTFQDIRGLLREIRIAYDENGLTNANKLVTKWEEQLVKASGNLKHDYGLDTGQGVQGSFLIKVYNSVAALTGLPQFPELEFKIPLPEFIQKNTATNFSNLYKDVVSELTSIERLGGMRDLMAAKFVIDDRHYVPPKTEIPM